MADPRQTREYSPRRSAANQAANERRYLDARQPGVTGEHDTRQTLNENVRRIERISPVPQIPKTIFAAAPAVLPGNPFPPPPAQQRDWHKKSDWYFTVTPENKVTSDPDPDPSAYHSITEAINAAKLIYPALALLYPDPIIEIEVHGGQYDEQIILDVNYLRFTGIGMPVISVSNMIFDDGMVSVRDSCTRVRFEGFEIVTNGGGEGFFFNDWVGIRIFEGAESGVVDSDIQFVNCRVHGTATQIYSERWSYFEKVKTYSSDGYDNGFPSVVCRFCFGDGITTIQKKWTKFVSCTISGQDNITSPPAIKKGDAFIIYALKSDLQTFVSNADTRVTMGSITGDHFPGIFSMTGVLFQRCEITGGGRNYGWAVEYELPVNIGGAFINDAGAGMVHLTMYNRTHLPAFPGDPDVNSYAWFHGGVTKSNYLVAYDEIGDTITPVASANVWCKHHEHTYPTFNAGGSAMLNIGGNGIGFLHVVLSSTCEQFWLNAGGATTNSSSPTLVARIAGREGYMAV